jgi:hypothetical protein
MSGADRGRYSSLTGAWGGAYTYPAWYGHDPVPFNARFEDLGGSVTGESDEPNTFADPRAARLFAVWTGTRQALLVSLFKRMDGTGGAKHTILYEGDVRADFMRIDGEWTIPGVWSGGFFMERLDAGVEAALSRSAETGA